MTTNNSTNQKINIAIVDDSKLSILGWTDIFKDNPKVRLIGTALNKDAFRKLCADKENELDVLIMDKNIDGKTQFDDFKFIEEIRKQYPDKKIIVYTWDYHSSHIPFLKERKINSYLPSNTDPEIMCEAIQSVMAGNSYFLSSPESEVADKSTYNRGHEFDVNFMKHISNLSPAENKVAALLAHDLQTRQVAERLNLSVKSVEKHISSIYLNLNISPKEVHARSEFNRYYGSYFREKYSGLI